MPIFSTSFRTLRQWGSNEVVRSLVGTLSAGQEGIGYKRAVDVARPAHLGAVIAAKTAHSRHDSGRNIRWRLARTTSLSASGRHRGLRQRP